MGRGYGGGGRKQYDNSMSVTLWKNERMRKGKQDPSWTGQGELDNGQAVWAKAWVNEDADGNKRINIKLEFKDDGRSPQQRNAGRGGSNGYADRGNRGGRDEQFDDHDRERRAGAPNRSRSSDRRADPEEMDDDLDDIPF